jgi:RimJ/RimL family protein N-acetyltransferase
VASRDQAPPAVALETERLSLEPLRVEHAEEMAPLLGDPRLHTFTGGEPPTLQELRDAYERRVLGHSADETQQWLNWIVRERSGGQAVGGMQATITPASDGFSAELAWVIAAAHQRRGYAREAAAAMVGWLRQQGAARLTADIHPDHEASMRVARALGLSLSGEVVADGELRWIA